MTKNDVLEVMGKDEEQRNAIMDGFMVSSLFLPVEPATETKLAVPFIDSFEEVACDHCGVQNPVPMDYIIRLAQQIAAGPSAGSMDELCNPCQPYLHPLL